MAFDSDPADGSVSDRAAEPQLSVPASDRPLSATQQTDLARWYRQCERRALSIAERKIGHGDAGDIFHSAVLRLIEAATRPDDPRAWPASDDEGCATLITFVRNGASDTAKCVTWRVPAEHQEAPRHPFWQRPEVVLPPKRRRGDRPLWLAFDTLAADDPPGAAGDARVAFIGRDLGVVYDADAGRSTPDARSSVAQRTDADALEAEDARRCEIAVYRTESLKFLLLVLLMKLPEQQNFVISWSFLRGMKRPAIARLLAITEKTYDNHRRQGLATLRNALRNKRHKQATPDERYWLRVCAWMRRRWIRRNEWTARQTERQRRIRRGEADPWRGKSVDI